MSANHFYANALRFIGVALMGLIAGLTLLGGVGTSCVAINPTGFGERMASLAPFQWLYILFVLAGLTLGLLGIRATVRLVKGTARAYQESLYLLIAGFLVGMFHMLVSRSLRGSSMPVDMVIYATVLTLVVFLLFRIPAIWQRVDFTKGSPKSTRSAGGAAAIILGALTLTIQYSMGPTHTWNGVNYADAFNFWMSSTGAACLILGAGLILGRIDLAARLLPARLRRHAPLRFRLPAS